MATREVSAGMIIYRETPDGPKFLLTYHGGRSWSFPKGKLDGESNFRAALREVEEETGIAEGDLQFKHHFKVRDQFTFTRDRERIFKTITYYLAETKKASVTLPVRGENEPGEPHEGYGWFFYRDALRMVMAPNLKRNLKRAYDLIRPASAGDRRESPKKEEPAARQAPGARPHPSGAPAGRHRRRSAGWRRLHGYRPTSPPAHP